MYRGNHAGTGYSSLSQISVDNVSELVESWRYSLAGDGGVPVDHDWQDLGKILGEVPVLFGPGNPFNHRPNRFQVGGVGRNVHIGWSFWSWKKLGPSV